MLFSLLRKRVRKEPPLNLEKAREIAITVRQIRDGMDVGRDSDGNMVKVRYPDGIIDTAALAASLAPDLPTSVDELERVFTEAEELISDAVHTS